MVTDPSIARCLDGEGRIALDLPCCKCRYNLRSLGLDDTCPECGTAAAESLKPGLLMFASPRRLGRLQLGAWLVAVSIVAVIVKDGGLSLLLSRVAPTPPGELTMILWIALDLLAEAIGLIGVILLTTALPAIRGRERKLSARRIARVGLAAMLAVSIVQSLSYVSTVFMMPLWSMQSDQYLRCASLGCGLVGLLAMAGYAAGLARRLPDERLGRWARRVVIGWAIALGVSSAISIARVLFYELYVNEAGFQADYETWFWLVDRVFGWLGWVLAAVFAIWAVFLLVRFIRRLPAVRRTSERIGMYD